MQLCRPIYPVYCKRFFLNFLCNCRKEEDVPTPPEPNPPSEMGGELVEGEEQVPE